MTGFLLTLILAVIGGWIGESMVHESMPGGFWGGLLAGLLGSWIGGYMPIFSGFGPMINGMAILPAIIGVAISVFILNISKYAMKQAR